MMPDCKACGSWFAAVNKREPLCPICERALARLAGYAVPVVHGCFEPCFDENGNWRQGFAKCSNCGKEYYAQVINHFGFCPNCGAKMDGGADHEA